MISFRSPKSLAHPSKHLASKHLASKHLASKYLAPLLVALLICQMLVRPANAAPMVVLAYLPENGEFAPPTAQGADVNGNNLTRGSGLTTGTGNTFNSKEWQESTLNDAIADNDCLYWGFSSTTAYDLGSLSIRYDRSETGPTDIVIQLDTGSGFTTVFTDTDINVDGEENTGIDLSAHSDVMTADFRLCGFGASNALGTFDIEATSSFDGSNGLVVYAEEAITPITLATFDLQPMGDSTVVEWTTATEIDNAGFNIYGGPSVDGPWTRLNASIIAATGSPTESASYSATFTADATYYLLEDVAYSGATTRHSPMHIHGNMSNPDPSTNGYASGLMQKIYVPLFQ